MYKSYVIVIFLLFSFIENCLAQETNIEVKLINKATGTPIEGASIDLYNQSFVIYKTLSDSLGIFTIPAKYLNKSPVLKIQALNYFDFQIKDISNNDTNFNKSLNMRVYKILPKNIELKEVKIKSNRRYRDTVKIDLSKKKYERSIMIEDILSKEFGFSRDNNGQIYYKGKPVTNVTVNGGDFFGKDNLDIYHLLPALILDKIQVIETNIDSTTNTTTLNSSITINLNLKEKYRKGKFGNINLGIGTTDRYVTNTNLYTYRNNEQFSLKVNGNNISLGDNTLQEPSVSFSSNGNNVNTKNAIVTYRNVYNKVEINLEMNGKIEDSKISSESDFQNETINLFSKNFNTTNFASFILNDAKFVVNYKIDSLTTINYTQTYNHSYIKDLELGSYLINYDSLNTNEELVKKRISTVDILTNKVDYQKKISSKKGRLLSLKFELDNKNYKVNEIDSNNSFINQKESKYLTSGRRSAKEDIYTIIPSYTEPLGENAYVNFYISYQNDKINYNTKTIGDTALNNVDIPSIISNQFFKSGVKFEKTFEQISLESNLSETLDLKTIKQLQGSYSQQFLNLNFNLRTEYKINKKKNFAINYSTITNYPSLQLLTSLNSTFDILSQNNGNPYLKPEEKTDVQLSYNIQSSNSETMNIAGEFDHYSQKIGLVINNTINNSNVIQNTFEENLGNSNSARISFSVLKNIFSDKYLNYSSGIGYDEFPTMIDNKLILNNGISFNQSLSTAIILVKPTLTSAPVLAMSFTKYNGLNDINITTLTYSDKLSFTLKQFGLSLEPLINYNHSLNTTVSFSMNGRVKETIFNNYGILWLQAYDIFNSFKYVNDYLTPSGYESVKYSNIGRYIILGLSVKFNNMK
ncbi:outer membrane beta-barrel protein [Mucilaginibacter sp. X5P1]|uniref:outer membrane beta-barrel protein n=1 Tax=Mucilaginibacter sp. X5P1 TaxID=2723088 RepID=UPI001619B3E2|nr:outer membrane beta-barrel protein [Mucilaginibacter sp. X5P1]MBB6138216.1 hypothetical protein [Mucilaginibacter sp. X5P1]